MMYYDEPTEFPYIERAILMEDVKLPLINEGKKLKRKIFYSISRFVGTLGSDEYDDRYRSSELNNEYKLAYAELKNITAKFYIPVLMAGVDNSKTEVTTNNRSPKTTGFKGGKINSLPYESSNCLKLTIPKYIILQFFDIKDNEDKTPPIIPKGTEFLICGVGGSTRNEHMRIIGLYTLTYDKNSFPNLKQSYYGGNPVK